jgi:hypothetical protein
MRLWTLHPRYLDTKGLLAVWREGLLAQQVLQNKTKGYRHHPQLRRFASSPDSVAAIAEYLREIHREAVLRGYRFQVAKITGGEFSGKIPCTRGQLLHEWDHLRKKLKDRDPNRYRELEEVEAPEPHPLFEIIDGGKEDWEKGIE